MTNLRRSKLAKLAVTQPSVSSMAFNVSIVAFGLRIVFLRRLVPINYRKWAQYLFAANLLYIGKSAFWQKFVSTIG